MFHRNQSGSTAVIFGLMLPLIGAGLAGAVEVTRMTSFKQRLTSATELACHQGAILVGSKRKNNTNLTADYTNEVRTAAELNLAAKELKNIQITPKIDIAKVSITSSGDIPFFFGDLLPKRTQNFVVTQECPIGPNVPTPSFLLFSESFEENHTIAKESWNVIDTAKTPFNNWTTSGAGLEINGQKSLTNGSLRYGNFFAELDSDCRNVSDKTSCASTTNSSISRVMTLNEGDHEIRYWYTSRKDKKDIQYKNYGKTEICSDLTKDKGKGRDNFEQRARSESTVAQAEKDGWTFKIELYVEKKSEQSLKPDNLMDVCVWADDWVERKLTFSVPSKADYRIIWRGAGRQDTYGGLLDYIRICEGTCP